MKITRNVEGESPERKMPQSIRSLTYMWAGEPTGQRTGRPRTRWRIDDAPCLSALALGRLPKVADIGWRRRTPVEVVWRFDREEVRDTLMVMKVPVGLWTTKLWLICPGCGTRRIRLYRSRLRCGCRVCLRIRYR